EEEEEEESQEEESGEDEGESEEEEEECGKEDNESGEEEAGSRDEKEELCEQQTGNEEEDAEESKEEIKGKELEDQEEFEQCEQGEGNKKEEEKSEESEEEEDRSEKKENAEEIKETKALSDDSEGEEDQESLKESEEEQSISKEDSKCPGELSECEEKKESFTKQENTRGGGEENRHCSGEQEEDGEGTEEKIDGCKSLVKEERTRNSESEGSENSKQRAPNNEEEEQKDSTAEKSDERNCGNEFDEEIEIGKSTPGADECDNWMEEVKLCEEDDEVSKGGSEEEEESEWFFKEPVEEKKACDEDRKSWASDDDYVTIASGHSQKEEEENDNMMSAWEQEWGDEQQTKETRDIYVEDFHESLGSPAASVLTSGYGTYRPDSPKDGDPEEVDYRDDCTLGGLEEESQSVLDAGDYEADSSPAWFRETSDGRAPAESPDASRDVTVCTDEDDVRRSPDQTEQHQSPTENDSGTGGSENVLYISDGWDSLDHPFNLRHRRGIVQKRPEEKQYDDDYDDSKKRRKEKRVRAHTGCLGTVSELEERLDRMRIGASRVHYDSESEAGGSYTDRSSSVTEEPPSAFQEYIKGMTRSHSESDIRPRPKSFIRPMFDHPHTRNLKKTDPVAKYFQYKQDWEMFKPPGEKSRKELHWAIREQLMYQPPPTRPQKTYIPNNYVVPTEKKRSALRWEIRHDLAHGIIPPKISYP
ncbi:FK506-binding protein 5-like, partial [Carassius auratus]|uniref:FK506-binding protein 5-like n=1 Tax=Carassius auratus TaxID=7957 RepID=A0A6P6QAA0_CARAU